MMTFEIKKEGQWAVLTKRTEMAYFSISVVTRWCTNSLVPGNLEGGLLSTLPNVSQVYGEEGVGSTGRKR